MSDHPKNSHGCECGEIDKTKLIRKGGYWQCQNCHRKNTMFYSEKLHVKSTRRTSESTIRVNERKTKKSQSQCLIDWDTTPTAGIGDSLKVLDQMLANI